MILWIFAGCLLAVLGVIGYYQGAIRVAFSLVGLFFAAVLAIPLGGLLKPIFSIFSLTHPLLLAFVAPAAMYVLILIIFKSSALAVHKKIDTHYKYKESDTQRMLWERVNGRLGICLGLANATLYLFLLAVVAYMLGYFTIQVSGSEMDSIWVKMVNAVAGDLEKTRMDKASAPFIPAPEGYFDGADILGDIYHNPLKQSRLSRYPVFLTLAEQKEFKDIGKDGTFQQKWLEGRPFGEFINDPKIKPLLDNAGLYTNVLTMLGGDMKDLKGYLETGKSLKYDDEKILGRWEFDLKTSLNMAKKSKPNMGSAELRWAKRTLGALKNASLVATIDNRVIFKLPSTNNVVRTSQGAWKGGADGKYSLRLSDGGKNWEVQVAVESDKLLVPREGFTLVFEK